MQRGASSRLWTRTLLSGRLLRRLQQLTSMQVRLWIRTTTPRQGHSLPTCSLTPTATLIRTRKSPTVGLTHRRRRRRRPGRVATFCGPGLTIGPLQPWLARHSRLKSAIFCTPVSIARRPTWPCPAASSKRQFRGMRMCACHARLRKLSGRISGTCGSWRSRKSTAGSSWRGCSTR